MKNPGTASFDLMNHTNCDADLLALRQLVRERRTEIRGNPVPNPTAVEVGCWAGLSTLILAEHFDHVFCVDTWAGGDDPEDRLNYVVQELGPERVFHTFCSNMGWRLLHIVFPCLGTSLQWASIWNRPIDFMFLDADHRYEAVSSDIKSWLPFIRPGGILACHDYAVKNFPGVTQAIHELLPGFERAGASIAWWRKPSQVMRPLL